MPLLSDSLRNLASALTIGAILIAGLILGREILIPLTIAVLLTFILTPVVGALSKLGLPKAAGVFVTIIGATVAVAMFAVIASSEILNLTSDLGKYRANVIEKVRTVSSASKGGSALAKASEAVASLGTAIEKEIAAKENGQVSDLQGAPRLPVARDETAAAQQPPPVLTSPQDANGRLSVLGFLPVLGQPLAQAALALLFTIFLMVQYRDLLDRIVRVVGTDHLSGTTSAMSEAGGRLSQIFLAQALLNGAFGLFIGLALWAIGIPSAALWGVVSAIMRFVPFIGSVLAAVPPVLLAAAVDPGWSILAATLALFIVGEPVMGHVVEPHVLGRKAGISPFAMVASASFWTLIWGPVGLVLAAPLTMVIVVLGRYVHGLEYFSVLLGDEPPLRPEQEFYHRLLSGDSISAADAFELELSQQTPGGAADGLVLPALGLAALDHRTGRLDEDQIARIKATMDELREITADNRGIANGHHGPAIVEAKRILVVAARGAIDQEAAHFVASLLRRQHGCAIYETSASSGLTALAAARDVMREHNPDAVLIVTVGGIESSQLSFVAKRARREFPLQEMLVLDFQRTGIARAGESSASDGGYVRLRSVTEVLERSGCQRSQTQDRQVPADGGASSNREAVLVRTALA